MARLPLPFFEQTLDFTCGPACLLMAMARYDPSIPLTQAHEVTLWREATLVEVGATSRYGLALAAWRRGHDVRIVANIDHMAFRRRILTKFPEIDHELMEFLWRDLREKCRLAGIPEERRAVTADDFDRILKEEHVGIFLTDTSKFGDNEPYAHWIVLAGKEGDDYLFANPLKDIPAELRTPRDKLEDVVGYHGDQLLVVVGPKRAGFNPDVASPPH